MQQSAVRTPLLRPSTSNHSDLTRISTSNYGAAETNELSKLLLKIAAQPDLFLTSFIEDVLIDHLEKKPRDPATAKAISDLKRLKNQITPVNLGQERYGNNLFTAKVIDSVISNYNICMRAINIALDSDIFAEDVKFKSNELSDLDEKLHKQIIDQITPLQQALHEGAGEWDYCNGCVAGIISGGTVMAWIIGALVNIVIYVGIFSLPSIQCFNCKDETNCKPPSRLINMDTATLGSDRMQALLYFSHISTLCFALLIVWTTTLTHQKLDLADRIKQSSVVRLIENKEQIVARTLAEAVLNRAVMSLATLSIIAYAIYRATAKVYYLPSFNSFINCSSTITYPPLTCNSADTPCTVNIDGAANRFIGQLGDSYFIFGLGILSAIYIIFSINHLINKIKLNGNSCFEATKPSGSAQVLRRAGIFAINDDLEGRRSRAESVDEDPNARKLVELEHNSIPKMTANEIAILNMQLSSQSVRP